MEPLVSAVFSLGSMFTEPGNNIIDSKLQGITASVCLSWVMWDLLTLSGPDKSFYDVSLSMKLVSEGRHGGRR